VPDGGVERVRLAEVLAALSLATDLGMGQPLGHAIRCSLIATRLADELGVGAGERQDTFTVGLLRYVGCTADAAEVAAVAGDEIAVALAVAPFVMGEVGQEQRAAGIGGIEQVKAAAMTAHCEAAASLAGRLRLGEGVVAALRHGFERWDGGGHPTGLAGSAIPLPTRIAVLARDVELWARGGNLDATWDMVRARRGRAYDPAVVDVFCAVGEHVLAEVAGADWGQLLAWEPIPTWIPQQRLDELLVVLADFADAKLPYALGHSRTVSRLVGAAAADLLADDAVATRVRQAGLVQDLGRVGVSNRIWDKPGTLSLGEQERVRLHPYLSEQVLTRSPLLRPLAPLAGAHHERLDGSGYYRGVGAPQLSTAQQILASADVYAALVHPRPHRPALAPAAAMAELIGQSRDGRLHPRAVSAVLAAAGEPVGARPDRWPAGLTDREVAVLRLACRGTTKQAVGQQLGISAKTVSRHLENAYLKIGVSTRAGAALYAVAHDLLDDWS
jgi:HD-GYP domain-containing protein (c-di-GMP phosphodiesterase class II)/DNA-binding CsgD family transcriptional regulator